MRERLHSASSARIRFNDQPVQFSRKRARDQFLRACDRARPRRAIGDGAEDWRRRQVDVAAAALIGKGAFGPEREVRGKGVYIRRWPVAALGPCPVQDAGLPFEADKH
jgi:hypothetical protein